MPTTIITVCMVSLACTFYRAEAATAERIIWWSIRHVTAGRCLLHYGDRKYPVDGGSTARRLPTHGYVSNYKPEFKLAYYCNEPNPNANPRRG